MEREREPRGTSSTQISSTAVGSRQGSLEPEESDKWRTEILDIFLMYRPDIDSLDAEALSFEEGCIQENDLNWPWMRSDTRYQEWVRAVETRRQHLIEHPVNTELQTTDPPPTGDLPTGPQVHTERERLPALLIPPDVQEQPRLRDRDNELSDSERMMHDREQEIHNEDEGVNHQSHLPVLITDASLDAQDQAHEDTDSLRALHSDDEGGTTAVQSPDSVQEASEAALRLHDAAEEEEDPDLRDALLERAAELLGETLFPEVTGHEPLLVDTGLQSTSTAEGESEPTEGQSEPAPAPGNNGTPGVQDTGTGKRKRQISRKATMELHRDARTRQLTDDEIRAIARQPPGFRKAYVGYWTTTGHIREKFYKFIFEKDNKGAYIFDDTVQASNVANMEGARARHEHPELFNRRGHRRLKSVKIRKDQRDPHGHFIKTEVHEMNESMRRRVVANAIRGESLLGALPLEEEKSRSKLKEAVAKAQERELLAKATIDEIDSAYRDNLQDLARRNRQRESKLKKENQQLQEEVKRLQAVIDAMLTNMPSAPPQRPAPRGRDDTDDDSMGPDHFASTDPIEA